VVADAVASAEGLGVAEGAGDDVGDGFVAAGEPQAEKKAIPSHRSRFIDGD
jgi:hypothetical protein